MFILCVVAFFDTLQLRFVFALAISYGLAIYVYCGYLSDMLKILKDENIRHEVRINNSEVRAFNKLNWLCSLSRTVQVAKDIDKVVYDLRQNKHYPNHETYIKWMTDEDGFLYNNERGYVHVGIFNKGIVV